MKKYDVDSDETMVTKEGTTIGQEVCYMEIETVVTFSSETGNGGIEGQNLGPYHHG